MENSEKAVGEFAGKRKTARDLDGKGERRRRFRRKREEIDGGDLDGKGRK